MEKQNNFLATIRKIQNGYIITVQEKVDSFISWPVNPNFTGATGILSMLGLDYDSTVKIVGQI